MPDPGPALAAKPATAMTLGKGEAFYRVTRHAFGYDEFNPGRGDTRFAPLRSGERTIPTLYGGETPESALLESIFHDIHHLVGDRLVYGSDLRDRGLVHIQTPVKLQLVDLRDDALASLGVRRPELVSTTAAHYACTREWADHVHTAFPDAQGMIWHSRQSELTGRRAAALILFGDRVPHRSGFFPLAGAGVANLVEGRGRQLVDKLATELDAVVVDAT